MRPRRAVVGRTGGRRVKILGLAGWSGSGKTTLLARLLPELIGRGLTVSTLKHAHHTFDIDRPGKDSHVHRHAGASEVLVSSARRWALVHEHRGAAEPGLDELLPHLSPVDLVLIEGYKRHGHDKLEVHRRAIGRPLLCRNDPHIVAVAADVAIADAPVPWLALDDIRGIADFIVGHCGI